MSCMGLMFLVLFLIKLVKTFTLPETPADATTNSSACYGTHTRLRPSCPTGSVIAVDSVNLCAKPNLLACPSSVTDADPVNSSCCLVNQTTDCIFEYSYQSSGLDYLYHKKCSGYVECTQIFSVAFAISQCSDPTDVFMDYTNYMFIDYSCIAATRIQSILSDTTLIGNGPPLYIKTHEYPEPSSPQITNRSCKVITNTNSINMFTLDMRLAMDGSTCLQSLTISYGENSHTWDCVNHTFFNVTVTSYPATEIYVTFQSNITLSDGYLWLGFEGGDLTLSCSDMTTITASSTLSSESSAGTTQTSITTSTYGIATKPSGASNEDALPMWAIAVISGTGGFVLGVVVSIIIHRIKAAKKTPGQDANELKKETKKKQVAPITVQLMNNKAQSSFANRNRPGSTTRISHR